MKQPTNDRQGGKRLWSKQEDQLLCEVVSRHNDLKWAAISDEFNLSVPQGLRNVKRTNKQCRQRWQNHLNPHLHNNAQWSQAQHELLFTLFREYSHQWCKISMKLEEGGFSRRGDNHIKNYFYSSIKKAIKRINEIVRQSNREIKKQKSILYQYNQKYAYKKRLSLERQILCSTGNSDSTSIQNHHPPLELTSNMRIIKQLDQEIVSKILLIAELKGAKKFTISNKTYEEDAVNTRNKLINYIKNEETFTTTDIINLTTAILELSRKCKRKNCRPNEADDEEERQEMTPEQQQEQKEEYQSINYNQDESMPQEKNTIPLAVCQLHQSRKQQQPLISVPQRKNSQEEKNLLQRFLCDDADHRVFGQAQKKFNSSQCSASKPAEEGPNSISAYFQFGQQTPRLCLDQSNSYFYGSNCFSNRDNQPFMYQQAAFPPSLAYADAFDSHSRLDHRNSRKEEEAPTNLAEYSFLKNMKEVQPRSAEHMFDFDIAASPGINPFAQGLFRSDSEQDRLFASQAQLMHRASSHRSNHSRSRPEPFQVGQGVDLLQSQQLLNRSWAYSSNRLEQGRQLCSSTNYEGARRNEFTVDLRNSNFYPFTKQQE